MVQVNDVIAATERRACGKGGARKLRAAGCLPAVVYGPGRPVRLVSLDPKSFLLQRQRFGGSHIYDVTLGDGSFKALVKEVAVDPLTRHMLHVDLYEVDMHRSIRVAVAVELVGKPAGLIDGGMLSQIIHTIEVEVLPDRIPEKLEADVSPLKIGDSLHLSDLKLPDGVRLTAHGNEAVALLAEPEKAPEPAEGAATATTAAAPGGSGAAGAAGSSAKTAAAKK